MRKDIFLLFANVDLKTVMWDFNVETYAILILNCSSPRNGMSVVGKLYRSFEFRFAVQHGRLCV